ncbi:DUF6303 family protein [Streptomyces olivoreticuli]
MAAGTFTAQMADSGGEWHLFVALVNQRVAQWPEYDWMRTSPTPTLTERAEALDLLGYQIVPGARWEWSEDSEDPDDPATPVRLIAAVTVRPEEGL